MKGDRMALYSFGAQHCSQREAHLFQHWTLLDMQLEISRCVFALPLCGADLIHSDTTLGESILQLDSTGIYAGAIRVNRVGSCKGRRAEQTAAKPRAFLIRSAAMSLAR